jgi:hypothetical protein
LLRYFDFDNRYLFVLAFILLALCPFFLIFKGETITEELSKYFYYLLATGIFFTIFNFRAKNNRVGGKDHRSFKSLFLHLSSLKQRLDFILIFLFFSVATWIFILYSEVNFFVFDTIFFFVITFLLILVRDIEVKELFRAEICLMFLNFVWIFASRFNSLKINVFFFTILLIPVIYSLVKGKINKIFLRICLYTVCFIFIWVNIPLIFTSQANNAIFTFNIFNKIPEEYFYLKNDSDSFKVVDLTIDRDLNLRDIIMDFYKYFYKKRTLKLSDVSKLDYVNIMEFLNKNYLAFLGKANVKYVIFHFGNVLPEDVRDLLSNRNYNFIRFGNSFILKNQYFEPPVFIKPVNDLVIVQNGEDLLEESLVRDLYIKNSYVYLDSKGSLNNYYDEIGRKDFLIPIDLNNPIGSELSKKFDLLYVVRNTIIDKNLRPSEGFYIPVEVFNLGRKVLNRDEDEIFNLSYHWQDFDTGEIVDFDGLRTRVPTIMLPGDKVSLKLFVRAPQREGTYNLIIDGVVEKQFWFSNYINGLVIEQFEVGDRLGSNSQSCKYLSNKEFSNVEDPYISYEINYSLTTDYLLIVNKKYLNESQEVKININGEINLKFDVNDFDYDYFDDFVILGKIKLINVLPHSNSEITFANLNFLKDNEGIRVGDVIYLLSADNIGESTKNNFYKIIEAKNDRRNLLNLKIKVKRSFIFVFGQDSIEKKKLYSDSADIDDFVITKDFYDTKIIFVRKPDIYNLYIKG